MTTKVIILCPDNSVHDAHVYVENKQGDAWARVGEPIVIPPREQSPPIYLTASQRVVIEEDARERVEPRA